MQGRTHSRSHRLEVRLTERYWSAATTRCIATRTAILDPEDAIARSYREPTNADAERQNRVGFPSGRIMIHLTGWDEASMNGKTLYARFLGTHGAGCSCRTVSARSGVYIRRQRELRDRADAPGRCNNRPRKFGRHKPNAPADANRSFGQRNLLFQAVPVWHGSTDFRWRNRFALRWFRAANQGSFRRRTFGRLAHGFDYFAHYAGKSFLVEAALGHEPVARGRAPPACNFRDIDVEPQGEMGERM
jgi:hypothetical protein